MDPSNITKRMFRHADLGIPVAFEHPGPKVESFIEFRQYTTKVLQLALPAALLNAHLRCGSEDMSVKCADGKVVVSIGAIYPRFGNGGSIQGAMVLHRNCDV